MFHANSSKKKCIFIEKYLPTAVNCAILGRKYFSYFIHFEVTEEKDVTNRQYTAGDIQVLEGLDAVRMRPGMYIGTTGVKGLHHILWEIVDNAVDEAANGFADRLSIVLNTDNSATVSDNGRGIPVDIHPQLKISGVEVVYTQLHAGGKFNNENYSYSGGLHGVGASVTNALSKWLNVEVFRNGRNTFKAFTAFTTRNRERSRAAFP